MVVIDEHDLGKTKIQVLMDLIYESTGLRIPEHRIKYGKPVALDQRPDLDLDPNTYIPVKIDQVYDYHLSEQAGFMYRRRSLKEHLHGVTLNLSFPRFPITLHELILEVINPQLKYPLNCSDFIDYEITDPETDHLKIVAHPESLLWYGDGGDIPIEPPGNQFLILVENPFLTGFYPYQAPPVPV